MQIEDPSALKERIGQRSTLRARFPRRPHPGPAALRMLRMLAGIFHTPARWRALALIGAVVVATVGLVLLAVRLASWNADFFDALEQKSWPGLVRQSWIFLGIVGATMVAQASALQAKRMLQITLRTHLTLVMVEAWMVEGRQARLQEGQQENANEDGRIAEDGRVVCEMVVDFLASLLYAVLQFVLFVGVLWFTSGSLRVTLGGVPLVLPGHMVQRSRSGSVIRSCARRMPARGRRRCSAPASCMPPPMRARSRSRAPKPMSVAASRNGSAVCVAPGRSRRSPSAAWCSSPPASLC